MSEQQSSSHVGFGVLGVLGVGLASGARFCDDAARMARFGDDIAVVGSTVRVGDDLDAVRNIDRFDAVRHLPSLDEGRVLPRGDVVENELHAEWLIDGLDVADLVIELSDHLSEDDEVIVASDPGVMVRGAWERLTVDRMDRFLPLQWRCSADGTSSDCAIQIAPWEQMVQGLVFHATIDGAPMLCHLVTSIPKRPSLNSDQILAEANQSPCHRIVRHASGELDLLVGERVVTWRHRPDEPNPSP
ncbi:MAG: hypothetical protein AAFV53_00115 [Myxococcota bacterium]